jgi:hypothetical protein
MRDERKKIIFETNKHGNLVAKIESPIYVDNGITNKCVGYCSSTMELNLWDDPDTGNPANKSRGGACIEWDIPKLDCCRHINISWEKSTLTEFDGVYSLPYPAALLLRKFGIKVPADFLS